jgi:hypothetical protein
VAEMTKKEKAARGLTRTAHKLLGKFDSTPILGIKAYEKIRGDWISENPAATELEILEVCIEIAAMTGLSLRRNALEIQLQNLLKIKPEAGHGD